jgi:hypothetical protein
MRRKLPAFKAHRDPGAGAEQLYRGYFASLTSQEFEGSRLRRIGHIKKLLADGILNAELRHCTVVRRPPQMLRLSHWVRDRRLALVQATS